MKQTAFWREKKRRVYTVFKIFSTCICWINIQNATLEVSGAVLPLYGSIGVKWLNRSDLSWKLPLRTADLPVWQGPRSVTECRTCRTRGIMQTCLAYSNCIQSVFLYKLCYASSAIFPQSKHNTASVWSSLTANKQRSNLTASPDDALWIQFRPMNITDLVHTADSRCTVLGAVPGVSLWCYWWTD